MLRSSELRWAAILLATLSFGCSGTGSATGPNTGGVTGQVGAEASGGSTGPAESVSTGGAQSITASGGVKGDGGASSLSGNSSTGGGVATGSVTSVGGTKAAGGAASVGGNGATGGSPAAGGTSVSGGSESSGGSANAGGSLATGGTKTTGGAVATGGSVSTGGTSNTGGVPATGGSKAATGGTSATGGNPATGGTPGTGGNSSTCATHSATATFRNPLNSSQGSDPYMFYYDCNYYLTATTWNSLLTVKKAPTIAALKTATATAVWDGSTDDPSRCCNYWAPEIHQLNGPNGLRWYFYYAGGPGPNGGDTGNQKNHVLESAGTDPMGPYTYKGHIHDSNDTWLIDASVVTINNSLYSLFSAWEGSNQCIYIAAMTNPWTMSGSRVRLSQPTYSWETQLANVNEGPIALQHDGSTFIAYSASACWGPSYAIGLLTLTGSNPLSASSWSKSATPVFQSSAANGVYGPAHNGFFKSPDGTEDWIVYHANDSSAGVCDTRRTTRIQKFTWNSDGTPNFGAPVSTATNVTVPSGE